MALLLPGLERLEPIRLSADVEPPAAVQAALFRPLGAVQIIRDICGADRVVWVERV